LQAPNPGVGVGFCAQEVVREEHPAGDHSREDSGAFAPCRQARDRAILNRMKPLSALALVFLGFGCSSAVPASPTSSEPSIAATSRSLLGSLRTRDREVLLYASPTGMKVTVRAPGGAILADRVDLDTLRTSTRSAARGLPAARRTSTRRSIRVSAKWARVTSRSPRIRARIRKEAIFDRSKPRRPPHLP
jgi:hypothetical protein